jgi:hypothetical protein
MHSQISNNKIKMIYPQNKMNYKINNKAYFKYKKKNIMNKKLKLSSQIKQMTI